MRLESTNTDDLVLAELGDRLARTRLERNIDQRRLATEAGISKSTVERLEAGDPVRTSSLIRVLRTLGLFPQLDGLVPEPLPRPIERLKTSGRQRKRASGRRQDDAAGDGQAAVWTWADSPADPTGE
jgi:transcriptional regulator with XRE-family HTH domain